MTAQKKLKKPKIPPFMNKVELSRASEFQQKHESCQGKTTKIYLQSVATGIGPALTIGCANCEAKEDISDIDSW